MKKRTNLGLKTLYDLCKIESKPSTYDLGYKLGPRINAGGRVGKSSHGAELLISDDPSAAYKIAVDLDKFNKERQTIEHFLIQQVRIPKTEKPSLKNIIQIAFNIGQFQSLDDWAELFDIDSNGDFIRTSIMLPFIELSELFQDYEDYLETNLYLLSTYLTKKEIKKL